MKVKCDYCGAYINDTDEKCPNCGAVNSQYKRVASDTPRTIKELEAWYKARKLPPYETTRFFIGIDYKQPKAFGIYQDGSNFVVYKNKADGSRAIRYEGRDEAYAVNELYLRLKEEILNQKSRSKKRSFSKSRSKVLKWIIAFILIFAFLPIIIIGFIFAKSRRDYNAEQKIKPQSNEYYYDNAMYYCDGYSDFTWWKYNESIGDYEICLVTDRWDKNNYEKYFPVGINNEDIHDSFVSDIYDEIYPNRDYDSNFYDKYNIYNSRAYIDAGHHYEPSGNEYYLVDGKCYYYLPNSYSTYGQRHSGWYVYDNDDWSYYCDYDDRDLLIDELWYDSYDYCIGDSFSNIKSGDIYYYQGEDWVVDPNMTDFAETEYYQDYQEAHNTYEVESQREREERESESHWSSSDNDYDWDSGSDSWDSGSSDWDSDW